MEHCGCPVDVISVCNAQGELRPLRLHVFLCRAKAGGHSMTIELKYTFRTHTWCLLRRLC